MMHSFLINDREYSRDELISFSTNRLSLLDKEGWEWALYAFILDFLDEEKALFQYTSGTTGKAKQLELKRTSMIHSGKKTLKYFGLEAGDSALLCLPVAYIAGKMMVVRAMLGGLNLLTREPSGNPLKGLDRKIDFVALVPLQLKAAIESEGFEDISKVIVGGGEISFELRKQVSKLKGAAVYESFGMSETYTHIAMKRMNGEHPDKNFKLLHGVNIELDKRGCLVIEAKGISETKIVTNDLVDLVGDTEFRWLGRVDNVIKSGAVMIIPEVVEAKIRGVISREVQLAGVPDEKLGSKLVLYIEGVEDSSLLEVWKGQMENVLGKYEMPREFKFVGEFDRTGSGKVVRM